MPERMPTEMAFDSDFLGLWFQVRLVERTRMVNADGFQGTFSCKRMRLAQGNRQFTSSGDRGFGEFP
jgi:hypothetical protein